MSLTVRARRPEDVPLVAELLMRQQPVTQYPIRNPLPFPVEEFVARRGELAAWVAQRPDGSAVEAADGRGGAHIVGHVSLVEVVDDEVGRAWSAAAGRPVEELAAVAVLVVDPEVGRRGIATRLMDECESYVRELGRTAVLEVAGGTHTRAMALYLGRGWQVVGEARRPWLPPGHDAVELMVLPDTDALR